MGFATVMYGGSSLAIYINGVTLELFNLVRANLDARAKQNLSPLAPMVILQADGLLDYMKADRDYQVDRTLPPRDALQTASRSVAVAGKILQNADVRGVKSPVVSQATRIGQVLAGMVEVALPDDLLYLASRQIFALPARDIP